MKRFLAVLALAGFPLVMFENGPRYAWREWKRLFWDSTEEA